MYELFTRTPKTERDIFIKSLIKLIENNNSLVKIAIPEAAEALERLQEDPNLSGKVSFRL